MFDPKSFTAIAPALAPFAHVEADKCLDFVQGMGATNDTTVSACLSILLVLAEAAENGTDPDLKNACGMMFTVGSAKEVISQVVKNVSANATDDQKVLDRGFTQTGSATQWIIDLVTASKKKPLDGSNVEGYYSSLGSTDVKGAPIAKMINIAGNFLTDKINDSAFREGLTKNIFMGYHTSRVSTGKLLEEISEMFTDLNIFEKNDSVHNAIRDSMKAPHDIELSMKIPTKLVGYAALFFEVSGKDVGKWYQGERALADVPTVRIKSIKKIFKKYLEIKNQIEGVDDAKELGDLSKAVGTSFF